MSWMFAVLPRCADSEGQRVSATKPGPCAVSGRQNRLMDLYRNCSTRNEGVMSCVTPDGAAYTVRNVYPPIQDLQPRVLVVVVIFVVCFVVGICGNTSVLTIIRSVMKERRGRTKRSGDNAILYIVALCTCDFLMSLSLPPAILDSVIGFWIFGTPMCKLHHVLGSVGRIVSTFLITAMSFDRYIAVCKPHTTWMRSKKFVISLIGFLTFVALALLSPLLFFAKAKEMVLHELKSVDSKNITRVRVFKCSDMLPPNLFYWFTITTFIFGFVIPLCLICFFNFQLARRVCRHSKSSVKTSIPARRIVIYTTLIAFVYFVCWTPYWFSVLYAIVMSLTNRENMSGEFMLFAIYVIHLMPYFGSASNWIFYGLLNTQLQMRQEQLPSGLTTCDSNPTQMKPRGEGRSAVALSKGTANGITAAASDSDHSLRFFQDTEQTLL